MKLTYVPVKIARSTVLLVTSPVESALRIQTAGRLLRREKDAEQVVFASRDGDIPAPETASGAPSADGALALASLLASENGVPYGETRDYPVVFPHGGPSIPCSVTPVDNCCLVTVTIPRPESSSATVSDSLTLPLVRFPGAAFFIVSAGAVQRTAAPELLRRWGVWLGDPVLGLLFWNTGARSLDPLIWDRAVGEPSWRRNSVGAAAALGAYLSGTLGQGVSLHQPGGVMAVTQLDTGAVAVTAPAEAGRARTSELVF